MISDYTKALFNSGGLLDSGATVLCYIATEYGQKDLAIAKRELELWEEFYPGACKGFFFDEASSAASELSYYEVAFSVVPLHDCSRLATMLLMLGVNIHHVEIMVNFPLAGASGVCKGACHHQRSGSAEPWDIGPGRRLLPHRRLDPFL